MLNRQELKKLIRSKGLVREYVDLETQLTPNGFDLTAGSIFGFNKSGRVDFSNKERVIPECRQIPPKKKKRSDKFGWWKLKEGAYKIKTNESVNLPRNLVALAFSRTSLLRMGAFTQHGVWDAGFCGRGEFVLVVQNPAGIEIKQNARIAQLIFFNIKETKSGYRGIFHGLK